MLHGTLNCVNLSSLNQPSPSSSSSFTSSPPSFLSSSLSPLMMSNCPSPSSLSTSSSVLSSFPYDPLESLWPKHIDDEVSNLALQACHQEVKRVSDNLRISPDPFTWTVDDVISWLSWQMEQFGLPMFPLNYFHMDGMRLCSLSESDFKERAQVCGDLLYAQLEIWKTLSEQACKRSDMTIGTSDYGSEGIQSDDELSQDGACEVPSPSPISMSPSSVSSSTSSSSSSSASHSPIYSPFSSSPSPLSSSLSPSLPLSPSLTLSPSPSSPSSSLSSSLSPSLSPSTSMVPGNTTLTPSSNRNTSGSHIHLWQFLKELLGQSQQFGSCIRWIDRSKGIFKIEDSVKVAKLWGRRKNRPAMNYDKLSRSIRQYYKKGIMKKTERSQRLVYQFCQPYCF